MPSINKYAFALTLLLFGFSQNSALADHASAKRPNVVLVMADDIGLGDISFYHRKHTGLPPVVATPNIDELASQGMRFADAHSPASLCAPSRYSMLTGNFPFRSGRINGVWNPHDNSRIEPDSTTIARIAKAGGYNTAFFGKWGLGESWSDKKQSYQRLDRGAVYFGFDYAVELPEGIQNSPLAFYETQQFMPLQAGSKMSEIPFAQTRFSGKGGRKLAKVMMGDSAWNPELAGPTLAHKAVDYIAKQSKDQPFFMYYSTQAVHIPHTPPAQLDGKKIRGATANAFGDMVVELDTQIGMLVKALKKQGLYENTLFVFTSDNGGLPVKFSKELVEAGHTSNLNLRNYKGSIYEGGHRVPFIAVWPGVIPANSESNSLIVGHDMVATMAAISGQAIEREKVKDALNLLPIFTGESAKEQRLYISHQSKSGPTLAIRTEQMKLIMKAKTANDLSSLKPIALFNMAENTIEDEAHNLIDSPDYAVLVKTLMSQYREHRQLNQPSIVSIP